jgi:O-methyltransferase involved in polyketide biosynthesis
MIKNIDSRKISPTAHLTAHAWDMLGISNAQYFIDPNYKFLLNLLRSFAFLYFINKNNDYVYYMLEPRHRAIEYFMFSKFPYNQVVEFASGLSPRGMTFSENPEITYIESDLPEMLELKKARVEEIYREKHITRPNHKFVATDLLKDNISEIISPLINKDEKLIVITEGLTPYFDMEHLKKIFTNISTLLRENDGGVYITDIYHVEDMSRSVFNTKFVSAFIKFMRTEFHIDIDNKDEGEAFFRECGFDFVETINPLSVSKQLGLKTNIPPEKNVATIYLAHVF